jgi:hypothetical protein
MGNDGHVTRPTGPVSQTYHNGQLDDSHHIKTLALASEVKDWRFSHYPTELAHPKKLLPNGQRAKSWVLHPFLRPAEMTTCECMSRFLGMLVVIVAGICAVL